MLQERLLRDERPTFFRVRSRRGKSARLASSGQISVFSGQPSRASGASDLDDGRGQVKSKSAMRIAFALIFLMNIQPGRGMPSVLSMEVSIRPALQ